MGTVRWQGNTSNAWAEPTNWIGGLPVHGDDVKFLGADLGNNRCAVGPTAVVLLNSIESDAAYDTGANAYICYALCGMEGSRIPTVTIGGKSRVKGGWIDVLTVNGSWSPGLYGGNANTVYLNGVGSTIDSNDAAIVVGTAYLLGSTSSYVTCRNSPVTIATVFVESPTGVIQRLGSTLTITDAWLNGASSGFRSGTCTNVYMVGDTSEVRNFTQVLTNVYVRGKTCKVSLTKIAAGTITNGPYLNAWGQVLYDYDTGRIIADTRQRPIRGGQW